ncbi:MAG: Lrp/AsnC family transcriptional regulator, partial [Thermoplasmatales archaeon]|nr:Lrp/AsnC family transcriptional regulator [Thermoplasmatales archaeon]
YDVAIVFTAEGIRHAKKFSETLAAEGANLISEIELMEYVFLLRYSGITNPEIDKFREFF